MKLVVKLMAETAMGNSWGGATPPSLFHLGGIPPPPSLFIY